MQHIETVTVGSGGAASITFSAIPDTYTDLIILTSLRSTAAGSTSFFRFAFNGSSANFTVRGLYGLGGPVDSFTETNYGTELNPSGTTANTFSNNKIYIPNYRSAVAKSFSTDGVTENNATTAMCMITAGLWNSVDAVTSITMTPASGNFVEFSSASLFGITAGSDGIVAVS